MANETEHWHTIEALFGGENVSIKEDKEKEQKSKEPQMSKEIQTKDIACNTDNNLTPVPAERKLSANNKNRKKSIEMVDKNLSPIQTPTKKSNKDQCTQTEEQQTTSPTKVNENRPEGSKVEQRQETETSTKQNVKKSTSEVEIQTCKEPEIAVETKAVQTVQNEVNSKEVESAKEPNGSELNEALQKLKTSDER